MWSAALTSKDKTIIQFKVKDNIIWLLGQEVKTPPFHGSNRGSIPLGVTIFSSYGRIAQLGEHLPYKQGVTGSSPVVPTMRWPSSSVG